MNGTPEFWTVDEVAARWRKQPRSVRDEINRKRLLAMKVCGQWLIRPEDVASFELSRMNVRPTAKRTRAPQRRAS
jgi:hypothetical protein